MSVRRYDMEWAAPPVFAQYLINELDPATFECSPVVTIFDPVAVDEENRVIVEVPKGKSQKESGGNFGFMCKVTVKSRWDQASIQADFAAHFNRTNWVRDALTSNALLVDLNAIAAGVVTPIGAGGGGIAFDYVMVEKDFSTDIREGWVYSETSFNFTGYFPA